jgi:hypothetical protein
MFRKILECFFFGQLVTETLVKSISEQVHTLIEQLKPAHTSEVKDRVDAAVEAANRDYQQVITSSRELCNKLGVVVQEYSKLTLPFLRDDTEVSKKARPKKSQKALTTALK